MTLSLYDLTVLPYRQALQATATLLTTAEEYCDTRQIEHAQLIQARLIADMYPFTFQIKAVAGHSAGMIEAILSGVYRTNFSPPLETFEELHAQIAGAQAVVASATREEVDSRVGRTLRFDMGNRHLDFTTEAFLMSYVNPNFYFHMSMAYAIMRAMGVDIGKRDFLGSPYLRF